jgi:hypothetical protein
VGILGESRLEQPHECEGDGGREVADGIPEYSEHHRYGRLTVERLKRRPAAEQLVHRRG